MAVLCGMSTIQYSARSAGFFKLNDLHISTSLSSVMTDIVDWSSLSASALCAVCRELAFDVAENLRRFLVRSVQARGMTWNWFQRVDIPYMDFRLSIVTAELCRPEVARRGKNRFFAFGKTTPYRKMFKILFWKDSSRHRLTCCVQISWNLADGNISLHVHCDS